MTAARRRPAAARAAVVPLLVALAGCGGLPDRGDVEIRGAASPSVSAAPFDFNPPGPVPDATQQQVVAGFLRALQATPASTAPATEFLTTDAAAEWRPDSSTVVYDGQRSRPAPGRVSVILDGAFELDETGRWAGLLGNPDDPLEIDFRLEREDGQWRIAEPPDATIIPRSHFATRYREYSLFFFDPTGSVLVPEPVYLPWGAQTPTQLVAGLLAGPPAGTRALERSFFPRSARLGVSVPVLDGVAEVPLSSELRSLDDAALELVLAQLSWTLRQVTDVERITVTVDGTALDVSRGAQTVDVDGWGEYDPAIASASTDVFGLRGRSVIQVVGASEIEAATLAAAGVRRPRSLGDKRTGPRSAVVHSDGTAVVVLARGDEEAAVQYPGTELLRPMWDRTDRLWLVDRSPAGAVVSVVSGTGITPLAAPGLGGTDVVAASLSREGTRLVAAVRGPAGDRLVVLRVVRDADGAPVRLTAARRVPTASPLAPVQGIGWRDPTTLAVLTRPSATTSEVVLASTDGASGTVDLEPAVDVLYDDGVGLAASPGGPMALLVASADGRLHELDVQGRWKLDAVPGKLRAPAFAG